MIKAVIIDIDDTFTMTEAVCFELENEVLASIGSPPMPREVHLKTRGHPLTDVLHIRAPHVRLDAFEAAYPAIKAKFVAEGKLDKAPEENYQALDALIALGKQVFILTSRNRVEISHLLAPDHLLFSRIKAFYYRDTMKFHKPDPRAFNQLFDDTGLLPKECVYVGDSLGDAESATGAGVFFIACLESGMRAKNDFKNYPVDGYINTFREVVNAVLRLETNS